MFIKFDIAEFYAAVFETNLGTAIHFAEDYVEITDEEKRIIHNCRKS